jgi:hypothetical protein
MNNATETKYPVIRKGEGGYWHAYGKGWAVCAPTREAVKQKYQEMLDFINELISRPVVKASDIL